MRKYFNQLADCGQSESMVHVFDSQVPDRELFVSADCSRPHCGMCEQGRARRIGVRISHTLRQRAPEYLWLVTISTRNRRYLEDAFSDLQKAWNRFQVHQRDQSVQKEANAHVWDGIDFYVGVNEITNTGKGFNLHRHLIVATHDAYWSWSAMHEEWNRSAQGQSHFNCEPIDDWQSAVRYVSKYLGKSKDNLFWGGLTKEQAYSQREVLRGKNRLLRSRGSTVGIPPTGFIYCCSGVGSQSCENPLHGK